MSYEVSVWEFVSALRPVGGSGIISIGFRSGMICDLANLQTDETLQDFMFERSLEGHYEESLSSPKKDKLNCVKNFRGVELILWLNSLNIRLLVFEYADVNESPRLLKNLRKTRNKCFSNI